MADLHTCPECGAELPAGAPDAPCAACLMQLGLRSWAARKGESPETEDGHGQGAPPTPKPAFGFAAPAPAELVARFPQLEILELRGQGGMGAVYKARQKSLDRLVALKIINPEAANDPGFASRFSREAKALARLNHPHIIGIHDFGEADGLFYFIMEYVDGVDLRTLISGGKLQPAEALALVPQICDALQYAHEEGIVHRDIKPENILVDKRGRVKIADFGLAKMLRLSAVEMTLTHSRQVVGTFHYMAPEQFERPGEIDHRVDIYALGVVFYEMLTGMLPVGRFDLPSQRCLVDARLDQVVLKALEREPQRRYQHASDIKTDVESLKAAPPKTPQPAPAAPPRPREPERAVHEVREDLAMPAIGLMVYGTLALLTAIIVFLVLSLMVILGNDFRNVEERLMIVGFCVGGGVLGSLVLATGIKLRNLENYDLVVAGVILTLCTFFTPITALFAIPLGIWSIRLLRRPDVRKAFAAERRRWRDDPVLAARLAVRRRMSELAWGLVGIGAVATLLPVIVLMFINEYDRHAYAPWLVLSLPGILIAAGGLSMARLGSYELARAGAIAAVLPIGPTWLVSMPLGAAALIVLRRPQVRAEFNSLSEAFQAEVLEEGERSQDVQSTSKPATRRNGEMERAVEEAQEELAVPAIGLMVYGTLGLLTAVIAFAILSFLAIVENEFRWVEERAMIVGFCVGGGLLAALVLATGIKMRRLESYDLVVAGVIVTLCTLFTPITWLFAIPLGVWSLVLLRRPQVRRAFALQRRRWREDPELAARLAVRRNVAAPAWGLVATGACAILLPMVVLMFVDEHQRPGVFPLLLTSAPGLVILAGGLSMARLGSSELALAGAVAALLPCGPTWLVSMPLGVAAILALRQPHVKAHFAHWIEPAAGPQEGSDSTPFKTPPKPGAAESEVDLEAAREAVMLPALALVAVGCFSFVCAAAGLAAAIHLTQSPGGTEDFVLTVGIVHAIVVAITAPVLIVGGLRMKQLESRWMGLAAALAALLPLNPAWLLGLPVGIWTLVLLNRRDIEQAIRAPQTHWEDWDRRLGKQASFLIAVAVLHVACLAPFWVIWLVGGGQSHNWLPATIGLLVATLAIVPTSMTMLYGAIQMRRAQSHGWSLAASIAALLPVSPAVLLGLPVGLSAVSLLTRPGVKEWFATPPAKPWREVGAKV